MVNQDQVWIIFEKYSRGEINKVTETEREGRKCTTNELFIIVLSLVLNLLYQIFF